MSVPFMTHLVPSFDSLVFAVPGRYQELGISWVEGKRDPPTPSVHTLVELSFAWKWYEPGGNFTACLPMANKAERNEMG